MIKAIIIDDEKDAQQVLQTLLHLHCTQVQVVASCSSVDDAVVQINILQPALVFLDIEMPHKNGFALFDVFTSPNFKVIFTTAYNQFAIKAFKYAAFDYLLKPIDVADLTDAISRYEQQQQPIPTTQQWQIFLQQFRQPQLPQQLALHTTEGLQMVLPAEVLYAESISNYTKIILLNTQKFIISKTLKEVEEILVPYTFYRIHNSYLVNVKQVIKFVKTDGLFIQMVNGDQLPLARNRKEGFMQRFAII
jgi:two-component system, LytTR family, response regulator